MATTGQDQRDFFEEVWLPHRPYATDSFNHGNYRRKREQALGMRFIETTPKQVQNLVVVDVDAPQAEWGLKELVYDKQELPEPNWIVSNTATDHAHAVWVVDGVCTSARSQSSLALVQKGLTLLAGGDTGYVGRMMRNPFAWGHATCWLTEKRYKLADLRYYTDDAELDSSLALASVEARVEDTGSRHLAIFDELRGWAYQNARRFIPAHKPDAPSTAWLNAVLATASRLNERLDTPMRESDVRAIARSVCKFVWRTHHSYSPERQEQGRARSIDVRQGRARLREENALELAGKGLTRREIAVELGTTPVAIKDLLHRARARQQPSNK